MSSKIISGENPLVCFDVEINVAATIISPTDTTLVIFNRNPNDKTENVGLLNGAVDTDTTPDSVDLDLYANNALEHIDLHVFEHVIPRVVGIQMGIYAVLIFRFNLDDTANFILDPANKDNYIVVARDDRPHSLSIPFSDIVEKGSVNPIESGISGGALDYVLPLVVSDYFHDPGSSVINLGIGCKLGIYIGKRYRRIQGPQKFLVPDYAKFENIKGMISSYVYGLLVLAEKFNVEELVCIPLEYKEGEYKRVDGGLDVQIGPRGVKLNALEYLAGSADEPRILNLDSISPVYKNVMDEYLGIEEPKYFDYTTPSFRSYFDFAGTGNIIVNEAGEEIELPWYIDVQIRVQFAEPSAETVAGFSKRRVLNSGNIQFLITTLRDDIRDIRPVIQGYELKSDVKIVIGKPIEHLFNVAQFLKDKYAMKNAKQILDGTGVGVELDRHAIVLGLQNIANAQFLHSTADQREVLLSNLFPGMDFSTIANMYEILFANGTIGPSISSFNTEAAQITNLRFAPVDRQAVKFYNPTYGLGVTIPFNYEQTK